jgi:hypothetical protein
MMSHSSNHFHHHLRTNHSIDMNHHLLLLVGYNYWLMGPYNHILVVVVVQHRSAAAP